MHFCACAISKPTPFLISPLKTEKTRSQCTGRYVNVYVVCLYPLTSLQSHILCPLFLSYLVSTVASISALSGNDTLWNILQKKICTLTDYKHLLHADKFWHVYVVQPEKFPVRGWLIKCDQGHQIFFCCCYNPSTIKTEQDKKHVNQHMSCFSDIVCKFKKVVKKNKAAGIHFCHICWSFCF